jgi:nucleoside-diphosphate-sugar epimerase
MKALVLGGTGFAGLRLVHALRRQGNDVTVLNRGQTQAALPDGVSRLRADRSDAGEVRSALRGRSYDSIFDFSGYTPAVVRPVMDEMAGNAGHYVFCSSVAVYTAGGGKTVSEDHPLVSSGKGTDTYAIDKVHCEEMLLEASAVRRMPATAFRPPVVYGPHNNLTEREASYFARLTRRRPLLVPGDGEAFTHQVHVDDLVSAFASAPGNTRSVGQVYNIVGPQAVSLNTYFETLGEATGLTPEVVHVRDHDLVDETASAAPEVFPFGGVEGEVYSGRKLREDLDWEAQYILRDGLAMTYQWWLEQGLDKIEWDFSLEDRLLQRLGRGAHP